jgi:hypothetical protein
VIQSYPISRIVLLARGGFFCLFISLCSLPGWADTDISTIRENLAKALEYDDQTAREQSDWRTQKEEMESLLILAREEERTLTQRLSASRVALDDLGEKKEALLKEGESRVEIMALLRVRLEPIKEEINRQYPNWPSMLQQDTKTDLAVLNNTPLEDSTTGNRKVMGAALDILKTVGEFQQKINQGYLVKELPDGDEAMFEVIFLGLAQGYYLSEDLELAGSIVFEGNQWVWKDNRKLLPALVSLSEFLRGNQQATLIELPLDLDIGWKGGGE